MGIGVLEDVGDREGYYVKPMWPHDVNLVDTKA